MAKGFVKIEFVDEGISVQTKYTDVGFLDKVIMLNGMFKALNLNMDDAAEVGMLCALAASIPNDHKVKIDMGAIGRAKEHYEAKNDESDDGEGA